MTEQLITKQTGTKKFNYPLYTTTRLKHTTLERLKKYGGYGFSIEDCLNVVLNKLEHGSGYEVPEDCRSW